MRIEIKILLYDILKAIDEIKSFFAETPGDFIAYQKDVKTRRAVERNIEIIGEAMNRVLQRDETIDLPDARKIVDTRNRIIHGYDTASEEIIWSIVIKHLPALKAEIEKLLNE